MNRKTLIPVLSLTLGILLAASLCMAKELKVQIHTIKGGTITEQQIRGWIEKANQADEPNVKFVVDSNHVYEPNKTYDPNKNDKGKINIWGLPRCVVTGEPNYVSGQKGGVIEIVPGKNDSNGTNVWVKESTLAHELNHIFLGPAHSNDPNNKMYPDNQPDPNGKIHSCHRKGTNLTPEQRKTISDSNVVLAKDSVVRGHGAETYDTIADVLPEYIDLDWTQGWIERLQDRYMLHLTAQVKRLSLDTYSELGFYIESDNNPSTGQPPEGFDYYAAFSPMGQQIVFKRYNTGQWNFLNPTGIGYELTYTDKDANLPQTPSGVELSMPMTLLEGRAGNVLSYRAVSHNNAEVDMLPNVGMLTMGIPPKPVPGDLNLDYRVDMDDLAILSENWLKLGISLADICPPPPNGDNIVNFSDFAILANNWLDEGIYTLNVNSSGVSGVSISSSTGHGGTTNYTQTLTVGTIVTLTAPATAIGKTFTGWTGDVNSSNQTATFSIDADKTVTANYALMNMVIVPAGLFAYQHNVNPMTYVDTFQIDKYEVTNDFYCQFLNNADPTGAHYDINMEIDRFGVSGSYSYTVRAGRGLYPIRYVSELDAEAFAAWRSHAYGGTYHLPTEQQWEKAAGWNPAMQHLYMYSFQQDSTIDCTYCNYGNCNSGPLPVGSFNGTGGKNDAKSYYGCYDMSGNVWEWTSSPYFGGIAIRGGTWMDAASSCTTTARNAGVPSSRSPFFGFRLVLDVN